MKIENIRHSLAHILASAVQELYPGTKFGIGPAIENGFYYDFDLPKTLTPEDLPKIEEKMREIIKKNIPFKKRKLSKSDSDRLFKKQPYKLELINELPEKQVTIYESGKFVDLCRGPHVKSTLQLRSGQAKEIIDGFKLTRVAGAYWKGEEERPMLTRIYGVAFQTKKELEQYLKFLEESGKMDHRRIGKDLDFFSFHEEAPGFVFWHPKGMILRETLMKFYNELHKDAGYQLVSTPILLSEKLWHQSGHWDNYKEKMYFTKIDERIFVIKPMNCPGTILIYNTRPRSYRELPLRYAEAGEVHRHEPSGTLHGLFRVRAFRQDDAHIFARKDQVGKETENIIKLILKFYKIFRFPDIEIELSTRPKKSIGTDEMWEKAESILKYTLKKMGLKFRINKGEGAFYGPKIDFQIKDSLARLWQCGTIQLDFSMPERFKLKYIDKDGRAKTPVMIHRTVIGSIQRFVGVLIEHYAGGFPLWLAPEQIWLIPVASRHESYAKKVEKELSSFGLRVKLKDENETVSKKIREGELQKISYLLVVGDKEIRAKAVRVRKRGKGDIGMVKLNKFIERVKIEIEKKN